MRYSFCKSKRWFNPVTYANRRTQLFSCIPNLQHTECCPSDQYFDHTSSGALLGTRYLLHDRDTKFCPAFLDVLRSAGYKALMLPPRSPNLNAFAERWVMSVKQECLSRLILFGENSLRRALADFTEHYHSERNHQGKGNLLLFPAPPLRPPTHRHTIRCRERIGGLLRYYSRAA